MRAPWERRKSSEYHKASDFEKQQWVAGIPARFWNISASSIRPKSFKYEGKGEEDMTSVTASTQQKYLTARIEQPELLSANRLVVMTSSPTDEHALSAAALMATAVIRNTWPTRISRVRVDDIQDYERCLSMDRPFYNIDPELLILYNFNPNSSKARLSLARDLLNGNEGVYRVIVAAADNPFQFARECLYMEPQEVYHFEGKPKKTMKI